MPPTAYARPLIYSRENLGIAIPTGFQADGSYVPHEVIMSLAIEKAEQAVLLGQHPVGAVITTTELVEEIFNYDWVDGRVEFNKRDLEFGLAAAHNQTDLDSLGHAEVLALRAGERAVAGRDTLKATRSVLYTTHIPCPMCAGAVANSKLAGVVYGTDLHHAQQLAEEGVRWRSNAVSGLDIIKGVQQVGRKQQFIIGGFMEDECWEVLQKARSLTA